MEDYKGILFFKEGTMEDFFSKEGTTEDFFFQGRNYGGFFSTKKPCIILKFLLDNELLYTAGFTDRLGRKRGWEPGTGTRDLGR